MKCRRILGLLVGSVSLGVMAAVALAAGGVSAVGPTLEGTATAPVKPSKIVGRVVSADAAADLSGVHVTLVRDGKPAQRTVTDGKGHFSFDRVAPGRFGIVAAKREVGAGRELSAVRPGDTVRVQIELRKPQ